MKCWYKHCNRVPKKYFITLQGSYISVCRKCSEFNTTKRFTPITKEEYFTHKLKEAL